MKYALNPYTCGSMKHLGNGFQQEVHDDFYSLFFYQVFYLFPWLVLMTVQVSGIPVDILIDDLAKNGANAMPGSEACFFYSDSSWMAAITARP